MAFQLAPDHVPPSWPDPAVPQQMHLDVMVDDLDAAEAAVLGARRAAADRAGAVSRVFADPAGHPFCLIPRPAWAEPVGGPRRCRAVSASTGAGHDGVRPGAAGGRGRGRGWPSWPGRRSGRRTRRATTRRSSRRTSPERSPPGPTVAPWPTTGASCTGCCTAAEPVGYLRLNLAGAQTEPDLGDGLEVEQVYVLAGHQGPLGWTLRADRRRDRRRAGTGWGSSGSACGRPTRRRSASTGELRGSSPSVEHTFRLGGEEQHDLLMRRPVD